MTDPFRHRLEQTVAGWQGGPRLARTEMAAAVADLTDWRRRHHHPGLWPDPPQMVTATVDDALGHGIALIEKTAAMTGIRVHPLGLMQPAAAIAAACRQLRPALLGITVLQYDSEAIMAELAQALPAGTLLVAGGPPLFADPAFADRCGVHQVVRDAAAFIKWLLAFAPMGRYAP